MKAYENVEQAIFVTKTLSWHITNFGKIRFKTEDNELIELLDEVIEGLGKSYNVSGRNKSLPICLQKDTPQAIRKDLKSLYNYCKKKIGNKKPEWQVLAERNGWTPPKKK